MRRIADVSREDISLRWETDLFDMGYIDSMGVVSLIAFIEDTYGVQLESEDLFDNRFQSISGIATILVSRLAASATETHARGSGARKDVGP